MPESKEQFEVKTIHGNFAERMFGRNAEKGLAAKVAKANPLLYKEARQDAVALGLLSPSRRDDVNRLFERPTRTYTEQELRARQRFTEAQCRELYVNASVGSSSNLAKLKANDPQGYEQLRTAAVSYGIVAEPEKIPTLHRKPNVEVAVPLDPSLAEKFGLPANEKVRPETVETALKLVADTAVAKAAEGQ